MALKVSQEKGRELANVKKKEAYELIKNRQLVFTQNDGAMLCASLEVWKQKGYQVRRRRRL